VARTSPTVRRRRLGQELRVLRDAKGLTVEQVAKELDWSPSKVSRIETTSIKVGTVDLRALLDVYEVVEKDRREGMLELGRESRETAWWMKANESTRIRGIRDLIGFEVEARRIGTYEPSIIPGLLQTQDYARAMIRAMDIYADADVDVVVEQRMARQEILSRADDPVSYTAIIDEAALRRPLGGEERRAIVMRDQLDKLITLNERSTITVLVVPFENGAHPGMGGGFSVMELRDPKDPTIVYVEAMREGTLLADDESVRYYRQVLERGREEALGQEGSRRFLRTVRDEYASGVPKGSM
jgi:transcriptional regulator with XRE-family HTH domain